MLHHFDSVPVLKFFQNADNFASTNDYITNNILKLLSSFISFEMAQT